MISRIGKIVAGVFAAFLGIACCIIAFQWYTEIYQYEAGRLRPIEPANYVDAGKTTCEVHSEILQVETVSTTRNNTAPNDEKRFPHSNKWLPTGCGMAPSRARVQFCEQCRTVEFLSRQREELERDLRAHNLWHELPQH
jgi:hypothetical protein